MSSRLLGLVAGVLLAVAGVACGGGGDDDGGSTGPTRPSICFSVSGFDVTVANLWAGGGSHSVNVRGLLSFSETVSRGTETHNLAWSNIQNNYSTNRVDAFSVTIDGRSLSYPGNRC